MASLIRILTAVPSAMGTIAPLTPINLGVHQAWIEVVYLGFHRYVGDIARPIQEDVAAIGISVTTAATSSSLPTSFGSLKKKGADDIAVFGGGGGTITHDDAREMKRKGVDQIFFAGTSLTERRIMCGGNTKTRRRRANSKLDLALRAS